VENNPILYFDGVCNLCNSTIDFFISKDSKKKFRYAPLQSNSAKKNLGNRYTQDLDTVVLSYKGRIYTKSQAILASLVILGLPYSLMGIFFIIPKFLSDLIYKFIAVNRYRFFGQKETCRLATPEEKELFLD